MPDSHSIVRIRALPVNSRGRVTALIPIDAAMKALAKATTVAEVKGLRDKAEAMRAYTRNVNAGLEAQIRCEAGQMLIDMAERGERRGDGNN